MMTVTHLDIETRSVAPVAVITDGRCLQLVSIHTVGLQSERRTDWKMEGRETANYITNF